MATGTGRFQALFTALQSGSGTRIQSALQDSDPFADVEMSADDRAALATEFQAFVTEGARAERAAGFKAGNQRALDVLSSDKGKAHTATALSFLGNEKLSALSAEDIIASLPEAPAAAAAAPAKDPAAAKESAGDGGDPPAGAAEAKERLEAAPRIALGRKAGGDGLGDGKGGVSKEQAVGAWGKVQKPKNGATGAAAQ